MAKREGEAKRGREPGGGEAPVHLSRRERQIMDAVYAAKRAGVLDVIDRIPDPPSYSAVRALLRILEEKGHLRHEQDGSRYVYVPVVPRSRARRTALRSVLRTFFDGSAEQAVAALIDLSRAELDRQDLDAELERLARLVERAREEGR